MVLTVGADELTRIYSALTTAHFYENVIWGSLGSRNYEASLQSAYSTLIQTETYGTTVASRSRQELHSGFVTPTTPELAQQTIVMNQAVESSQNIPMLDRLEGVLGGQLFDRAAREAAIKMANHVDDYFGTLITGSTFKDPQKLDLGSDTNYVRHDTGKPGGTDATGGELILDAAEFLIVWARRANILQGIQIGGPQISDLYIVMQPELAALVSRALLNAHGQGTLDEVRGLVREGILRYDTVAIGRAFGVDLYSSSKLAKPTQSGNNAATDWKFYGGVRQAVEFAARPLNTRRVDARTRESGGWVDTMGSMMQYGGKIVNIDLLVEFSLASTPAP